MSASTPAPFDGLTAAAFDAVGWQALLADCATRECSAYQERFRDRAKELETEGQKDAVRAARALQWLAALQMRLDNPRQPFQGLRPMPGFQFPDPEDFGEPLLAIFAEMACVAADPEFKARLADVCWSAQKKRNISLVAVAVQGYLESSDNLRTVVVGETAIDLCRRWDAATVRLRRALQLARMTKHVLVERVREAFESIFKNSLNEVPFLELGQLLTAYQNEFDGDINWLVGVSGDAVNRARAEKKWPHLRHFLRLRANWQKKAGLTSDGVSTEIERAEAYLPEADENPTYHGKARWVAKAIKAYRAVSPQSPRIEALKILMDDYQRQGMGEMRTFNYEVDLGDDPLAAVKHIAGLSLPNALRRLVTLAPPLVEQEIREAVIKRCRDPWFALSSQDLIDWDGRVIARRGSVMSDDPEVRDHAVRAVMFRTALDRQKTIAAGRIEPARLQLISEHNVTFHDLYFLLVDSPFIPPGRESLFVRGLCEGLNGDFVLAAHLLIPQLEHSLRFHLERCGADVTTLKDGIQEMMDLNKLFGLRREPLIKLFGPDQVFELEGLLVRRYGANLRNSFAHGLFWPDQFNDGSVIYLWWVTLRLCLIHLFSQASDGMTNG